MRELAGRLEPGSGATDRCPRHRQRYRPGSQPAISPAASARLVGRGSSPAALATRRSSAPETTQTTVWRRRMHRSGRDGAAMLYRPQRRDVHALWACRCTMRYALAAEDLHRLEDPYKSESTSSGSTATVSIPRFPPHPGKTYIVMTGNDGGLSGAGTRVHSSLRPDVTLS